MLHVLHKSSKDFEGSSWGPSVRVDSSIILYQYKIHGYGKMVVFILWMCNNEQMMANSILYTYCSPPSKGTPTGEKSMWIMENSVDKSNFLSASDTSHLTWLTSMHTLVL